MVLPKKPKGVQIQDNESNPHFFTVIVSPSIQLRKLKIPNQFVKDHGKKLSNFAYLKVPNGEDWLVQLLKCEGNIVWFHSGWNHFAENYSVSSGCFLVFRYDGVTDDGISRFRVLIFGTTCSEINYSRSKLTGGFQVPMLDNIDTSLEDEQGEILDDIRRQSGKSYADPIESPLQRAMAFQSPNPNFIIRIHKRNLSYNSGPALPMSHCRTYFKENNVHKNTNKIILRVNKKAWRVKCRSEKKNRFCISMSYGWKEFALQNELQDGDNCVFEMIKKDPKSYNVHFFRVSRVMAANPTVKDEEINEDFLAKTSGRRGKCIRHTTNNGTLRALENRAKAFIGDSPGFISPMRKSYVVHSRAAPVPHRHSCVYLKDEGADLNAIVINGKGGKTWKVAYRFEASFARLACGWGKFKSDNRLEIGDVCAFKLIDRRQKTYEVDIFRINGT